MTTPTQVKHPWRATARTVFAAAVAGAPVLSAVLAEVPVDDTKAAGWYVAAVAGIGAVTRILTLPAVDGWLKRFLPFLAAQPPTSQ